MTAEAKCKVCKELIAWANRDDGVDVDVEYMQERIYAVKLGEGRVMLVEADKPRTAIEKATKGFTLSAACDCLAPAT